jgi:hypothetical protein
MENGRKFLDLCCDVCVDNGVDNVDVGCGWVDNCSRLKVVSIVALYMIMLLTNKSRPQNVRYITDCCSYWKN